MKPACADMRRQGRQDVEHRDVVETRGGGGIAAATAPGGDGLPAGRRRILHVVSSLERGGIEFWLLQLLQTIDRDRYQMDFLVLRDPAGVLAQELRNLGCRIWLCASPRNPWRVRQEFAQALEHCGPYDVVHSHVHHYSGLIVRLAALRGIPIRIAHSHNDTRPVEADASWRRRFYLMAMKQWILRHATHRVAVSRIAAEDLFGPGWREDPQCEIILCGLDFAKFADNADRAELRDALGLPEDALVLGHVGRFHARKNHSFLLKVGAEAMAREPRTRLLLVGDGELMPTIQAQAQQLGIADRVVFTGARGDVAALMRTMDVFIFPSHHEGLGLVLLEAQATGLPCVLAEGIPEEADVVLSLMHRLPLTAPAADWAGVVLRAAREPLMRQEEALRAILASDFNIERSAARIAELYASEVASVREHDRADDARTDG
jgi:glycosyltransferase involved in cell wall biosynthesis